MKPIEPSRRGGSDWRSIAGIVILVAGLGFWMYHRDNHDEAQRMQQALQKLEEQRRADEAKRLADQVKQLSPEKDEALSADDAARFVGRKARVSHPHYFSSLGGIPAFGSWAEAARLSFPVLPRPLAGTTPPADLEPTETVKQIVREAMTPAHPGHALLPTDSEFEISDVHRVTPSLEAPQLVYKVHATNDPARQYMVNSSALTLIPASP